MGLEGAERTAGMFFPIVPCSKESRCTRPNMDISESRCGRTLETSSCSVISFPPLLPSFLSFLPSSLSLVPVWYQTGSHRFRFICYRTAMMCQYTTEWDGGRRSEKIIQVRVIQGRLNSRVAGLLTTDFNLPWMPGRKERLTGLFRRLLRCKSLNK